MTPASNATAATPVEASISGAETGPAAIKLEQPISSKPRNVLIGPPKCPLVYGSDDFLSIQKY
jgi:hypothetical protein